MGTEGNAIAKIKTNNGSGNLHRFMICSRMTLLDL